MRWWEARDPQEGGDQEIILQAHVRTGPHFPFEVGCISTVWMSPLFHPKCKCPGRRLFSPLLCGLGPWWAPRRAGYCVNETAQMRQPPSLGLCTPLEGSLDLLGLWNWVPSLSTTQQAAFPGT